MFGYITPDKPELKMKEFDIFRSYYCGVCKSMGKNFGVLSRFALNYDSVFLGLFLAAINGDKPDVKKEICFANPLKRKFVARNSMSIDYAADINVMLLYHKLKDNWYDERDYKSLMGAYTFEMAYKKAKERNTKTCNSIVESLNQLGELEKQKCKSIDQAAEPFADMMRKIIIEGYIGNDNRIIKVLSWVGYNIGKWVYIIDAYDDIDKDIKSNSYNPLLLQYDFKGSDTDNFKDSIKHEVKHNLIHALWQASNSLDLIKIDNRGIIDNILYEGMYKKTETIIDKRSCNRNE